MRIEDYGFIGDTQTGALVGRDGAVDWLCLPRYDSASCFAALVDDERHGCWRLAPAGATRATARRYRPGTLVLETEYETDDGAVCADFVVAEGARERLTLTWHASFEQTPPVEDADSALARTEAWWRSWSGRCESLTCAWGIRAA